MVKWSGPIGEVQLRDLFAEAWITPTRFQNIVMRLVAILKKKTFQWSGTPTWDDEDK